MISLGEWLNEKITDSFNEGLESSKRIRSLLTKQTDYRFADAYAKEVGNILAKSVRLHIDDDILPDGRMPQEAASLILTDRMTASHALIADYCYNVQNSLNRGFSIGLKPKKPNLDRDRIDGLIKMVSEADSYGKVADSLRVSLINAAQAVVVDSIHDNMEFQAKAGLKPILVRSSNGKCCDWCDSMQGVYNYPVKNSDVYKRHQSCTCTVTYYPGSGIMQDAHSKKFYDTETGKAIKREQVSMMRMKARK